MNYEQDLYVLYIHITLQLIHLSSDDIFQVHRIERNQIPLPRPLCAWSSSMKFRPSALSSEKRVDGFLSAAPGGKGRADSPSKGAGGTQYTSHSSTLIWLDLTSLSPPVGDKIIYNNIINAIKTKLCSNSAYGKPMPLGVFLVFSEACSVNTGWDLTAKPWANTQWKTMRFLSVAPCSPIWTPYMVANFLEQWKKTNHCWGYIRDFTLIWGL